MNKDVNSSSPEPESVRRLCSLLGDARRDVAFILGGTDVESDAADASWTERAKDWQFPGTQKRPNRTLVAQYARLFYGRDAVEDAVRQDIRSLEEVATESSICEFIAERHRAPIVVTTALDPNLEGAFHRLGKAVEIVVFTTEKEFASSVLVYRQGSAQPRRPMPPNKARIDVDMPIIFKLRGSLDLAGLKPGAVLDEEDIAWYLVRQGRDTAVPAVIRDKLEKSCFLFLNYDLEDWTNRVVLHTLSQRFRSDSWQAPRNRAHQGFGDSQLRSALVDHLAEHMLAVEDRKAILRDAFPRDLRVVDNVVLNGNAADFAQNLVTYLLSVTGWISEDEHSLIRLLRILESRGTAGPFDIDACEAALGEDRQVEVLNDGAALPSWSVRPAHTDLERSLWQSRGVQTLDMSINQLVAAVRDKMS